MIGEDSHFLRPSYHLNRKRLILPVWLLEQSHCWGVRSEIRHNNVPNNTYESAVLGTTNVGCMDSPNLAEPARGRTGHNDIRVPNFLSRRHHRQAESKPRRVLFGYPSSSQRCGIGEALDASADRLPHGQGGGVPQTKLNLRRAHLRSQGAHGDEGQTNH